MNLLGRGWRLLTLIILTAGLFGCDYASKSAAKAALENGEVVAVAPTMLRGAVELRYVENEDIAFNALRRLGIAPTPTMLLALSTVALIGLAFLAVAAWRRTAPRPQDRLTDIGLAMVAGGALGNVVDRALRGYVVDFIHVKGWPVFNVADIAVVVGMGLVLLARIHGRSRDPVEARDGPS